MYHEFMTIPHIFKFTLAGYKNSRLGETEDQSETSPPVYEKEKQIHIFIATHLNNQNSDIHSVYLMLKALRGADESSSRGTTLSRPAFMWMATSLLDGSTTAVCRPWVGLPTRS